MNKVGIVSTRLGKEILGLGDARNEMICFVFRHRAGVSGNESQEECRGGGRNLPSSGQTCAGGSLLGGICTITTVIEAG